MVKNAKDRNTKGQNKKYQTQNEVQSKRLPQKISNRSDGMNSSSDDQIYNGTNERKNKEKLNKVSNNFNINTNKNLYSQNNQLSSNPNQSMNNFKGYTQQSMYQQQFVNPYTQNTNNNLNEYAYKNLMAYNSQNNLNLYNNQMNNQMTNQMNNQNYNYLMNQDQSNTMNNYQNQLQLNNQNKNVYSVFPNPEEKRDIYSCQYCEDIYKMTILYNYPLKKLKCLHCGNVTNVISLEYYMKKFKHELMNIKKANLNKNEETKEEIDEKIKHYNADSEDIKNNIDLNKKKLEKKTKKKPKVSDESEQKDEIIVQDEEEQIEEKPIQKKSKGDNDSKKKKKIEIAEDAIDTKPLLLGGSEKSKTPKENSVVNVEVSVEAIPEVDNNVVESNIKVSSSFKLPKQSKGIKTNIGKEKEYKDEFLKVGFIYNSY